MYSPLQILSLTRKQISNLENLTFNEFAFQEAFITSIYRWNNILGRLDLDCSAMPHQGVSQKSRVSIMTQS